MARSTKHAKSTSTRVYSDPSGKSKGRPQKSPKIPKSPFLKKYNELLQYTIGLLLFFAVVSYRKYTKKLGGIPEDIQEDLKGGIEDICPKMDLSFEQIKKMTTDAYVRPQNMVRGGKFLIPILGYGRMTQLRNLVEATIAKNENDLF